jgi:paraquat-inducible protein A
MLKPCSAGRCERARHEFLVAATKKNIVVCKTCGLVQRLDELAPGMVAECARCGSILRKHKANSLGRTAAFSLSGLVFYVPANIYPILHMKWYGAQSESTVWDGCVSLFQSGQWLVAAVVFFASILTPLLKLVGLFYLVATTKLKSAHWRRERTWTYKTLEVIGPWSMLDVFLLAVLVALVRLGELATVLPGRGLFAFTAMVVLTILATSSFDPTLIWQEPEKGHGGSAERSRTRG